MSLRVLAEKDLGVILEDQVTGFGWPITITSPDNNIGNLIGRSNDIAQVIDPDTGMAISGRFASVSIRISSLISQGLNLPVAIADDDILPWRVTFNDINGNSYDFKVSESNPDRTLGYVTLQLEAWNV